MSSHLHILFCFTVYLGLLRIPSSQFYLPLFYVYFFCAHIHVCCIPIHFILPSLITQLILICCQTLVNTVLAQSYISYLVFVCHMFTKLRLYPVCTKSFSFSYLCLMTSMKISNQKSDSLLVSSEIVMVVTMKRRATFWDVMKCEVYHKQLTANAICLLGLLFDPEYEGSLFISNISNLFTTQHCVAFKKVALFLVTYMRTSNLTY